MPLTAKEQWANEAQAVMDMQGAQIENLKDALKPFAELASEFCVDELDPHTIILNPVIRAGDLLAAFNALQPVK